MKIFFRQRSLDSWNPNVHSHAPMKVSRRIVLNTRLCRGCWREGLKKAHGQGEKVSFQHVKGSCVLKPEVYIHKLKQSFSLFCPPSLSDWTFPVSGQLGLPELICVRVRCQNARVNLRFQLAGDPPAIVSIIHSNLYGHEAGPCGTPVLRD